MQICKFYIRMCIYACYTCGYALPVAIRTTQPGFAGPFTREQFEFENPEITLSTNPISHHYVTACNPEGPEIATACENRDTLSISCPTGQVIDVIDGFYGRTVPDTELCLFGSSHQDRTDCRSASSSLQVKQRSAALRFGGPIEL